MARMKRLLGVRWGHNHEIDRRIHVGTPTWKGLPARLRHLTAWRAAHKLSGGKGLSAHMPARMYGTRHKIRPSSDLPITGKVSKLALVQRLQAGGAP